MERERVGRETEEGTCEERRNKLTGGYERKSDRWMGGGEDRNREVDVRRPEVHVKKLGDDTMGLSGFGFPIRITKQKSLN